MSSVDYLLNSSDSDDEMPSANGGMVDLESLLMDKDDSDDDVEVKPKTVVKVEHVPLVSTIPRPVLVPKVDKRDDSTRVEIQKIVENVDLKSMAKAVESNLLHKTNLFEQVIEKEDQTSFNSLEMAEQREQRFLKSGSREIVSALQAKRINSALSSYSNVKLDDMSMISNQLKRNGSYKQHGPGAASCLLVTLKFIAVGTTRGLIILFDNNQEIRQVLGSSIVVPARSAAPIVTLDVSQPSCSLLICGYATGELALWDIVKGTLVMRINDLHLCKVVKVSFIRNISESLEIAGSVVPPSELVVVSADCKGIMHRTRFIKGLWTAYSTESKCLLDGTSGSLLDISILMPFHDVQQQQLLSSFTAVSSTSVAAVPAKTFYSGILRREPAAQLLCFNFVTQTCLVRVAPTINIIYKWAAPASGRSSAGDTAACLDFSWAGGTNREGGLLAPVPVVVRCWNSTVEVLCVTEGGDSATAYKQSSNSKEEHYSFNLIAHKVFEGEKFLSVKWLNATRLILITASSVLVLSSTLDLIEQSSLLPVMATNINALQRGVVEDGPATFLNIVSVSGKFLHILSVDFLFQLQLQSCFDMANQLIYNGQWLEALALILENVSKSPSLLVTNESDVDKLIIRYVQLAVQQPSHFASAGSGNSAAAAQSKNHYHLVAGVCIEYCVTTQRMDLLYGELFDIFTAAHHQVVFLESLEPHILSRSITRLPPNIIQEFFTSSVQFNRLPSIERCVTYFDIHSVDLNFITRFLYDHNMYSSFLYAFAFGLGDFVGAFQTIFSFMLAGAPSLSSAGPLKGASVPKEDDDLSGLLKKYPSPEQSEIGYKLLLFLLYTFEGRVFPRGDALSLSKTTVVGLLSLVTQSSLVDAPQTFAKPSGNGGNGLSGSDSRQGGEFPYLTCLSYVDPAAVLHCVSKGLEMAQSSQLDNKPQGPSFISPSFDNNIHDIHSELSYIYRNLFSFCRNSEKDTFLSSYRMKGLFLEKYLTLLSSCPGQLDEDLLEVVVKHCASKSNRKGIEQSMVLLAEHQARFTSSASKLKQFLHDGNFWIAALSIKKSALVNSGALPASSSSTAIFAKALKYYISIAVPSTSSSGQPPLTADQLDNSLLVFDYIESQLHFIAQVFITDSAEQRTLFCSEIVKVVVELYVVDAARTTRIVCSQLTGCVSEIIANSKQDVKVQYELLHSIVESFERDESASEIMTVKDCFSSKNVIIYFKLLCAHEPNKAFSFLKKYQDLYPVEECLSICRDQGISDAVSYLLERNNDIPGALSVLQKDFSLKVKLAKRDIDTQMRVDLAAQASGKSVVRSGGHKEDRSIVSQILSKQGAARVEATMRLPVFKTLSAIVNCAADLCVAHATSANPSMWLSIFDHLLVERQTIRSGVVSSSGEIVIILIGLMLQALMNKMKGVVTPQEIIRRVTAQSSASGVRLGEFKDVMINMLETNTYELFLNETVNQFIHKDLVEQHREKYTIMRKACYRSKEEGGDPSEAPKESVFGSDPNSPARSASDKWKSRHGGSKKIFKRHSEFSKNISMDVFTAVPNVVTFSDFESRSPGAMSAKAIYTAHMHL